VSRMIHIDGTAVEVSTEGSTGWEEVDHDQQGWEVEVGSL